MIYKIDNIKLGISESEDELQRIAENKLGEKPSYFRILKKSLDARRNELFWVYSVEFSGDEIPQTVKIPSVKSDEKIVIVGAGPAGLSAAVRLCDAGLKVTVIERGKCVEDRERDVDTFNESGIINTNSNIQFGEGGAGTFSDGKLNTQTHRGYTKEVLDMFCRFGAPEEITYLNKPHVGSDKLKEVLVNIRNYLLGNGCIIMFGTRLDEIIHNNGNLTGIAVTDVRTGSVMQLRADRVILAVGHSARDTFGSLVKCMSAERKDFAVGVRIEHSQEKISFSQYGKNYRLVPPADYKLVSHAGIRTCFTFCNCPGGYVVAGASEENGICTNGMSNYARDGANCNSALMVSILQSDLQGDDIMAGVNYQREIERKAFSTAGGKYKAPCQSVGSLLRKKDSSVSVSPTYPLGTAFAPLGAYLPGIVVDTLKAAITDFGKKIHGFDAAGAVITGPETRFTSPLRFLRNETMESVNIKGVYPCGEGSGYAGGITSSASDGLRAADTIINILAEK